MDRTLESVHRPANRKRYSAVTCMRGRLTAAARKEEDPMEIARAARLMTLALVAGTAAVSAQQGPTQAELD